MATVIRTGGQTIRISNGTSSARRAVEAVDPISAAMEAGEAFARSEIACEAFGALVNRAAQMSMEGKASMWKRVKAAGSRTWEAIKEFFRKMIAYVTSFISGNVIMLKAKRLKKRIEDDEDLWTENASENWDKKKFSSFYKTISSRDAGFKEIEASYKAVCNDAKLNSANQTASDNIRSAYGYAAGTNAYSKEKDLKKSAKAFNKANNGARNNGWDDAMTNISVTCKDYFGAHSDTTKNLVMDLLTKYSKGMVKAMVFLKATVVPTLNKMYKLAEKYAKEAADNNKVASFKDAQREVKHAVTIVIKQTQTELSMIAGAIAEPSD